MITEQTRQKMREAHARRIARGEKFGFQKGHKKLRGKVTAEETKRRTETFKKNYIQKPKPSCEVCGTELWKWKDKRCRAHTDYSFRKGKPSPHKGKTWKIDMTPERKARWSELGRQRKHTEKTKQKIRDWHVAHPNRVFQDTSIELAIQDELADRQIVFIKQFIFSGIARVDFYLPEFDVVVQCDGCYWHNCLEHYPTHNQKQRQKDLTKDAKLAVRGIKVVRFWEHDIKKSAQDCVNQLLDIIN